MTIATPPPPPAPPAGPPKRRIGDMFVEAGLLTPDQIELAVQMAVNQNVSGVTVHVIAPFRFAP